jgi:hypothetical protein
MLPMTTYHVISDSRESPLPFVSFHFFFFLILLNHLYFYGIGTKTTTKITTTGGKPR